MKREMFMSLAGVGLAGGMSGAAPPAEPGTVAANDRRYRADGVYQRRVSAAAASRMEYIGSSGNGDEARYAASGYMGNFAKGLPHEPDGTVSADVFESMIRALELRSVLLLDLGASASLRRLVAEAIHTSGELAGCDYTGIFVPPAPALASARTAADTIELYWLALTRDIAFSSFGEDPMIARACADLSRLTDFEAPRLRGAITPDTIFRGPGRTINGPYVSQFFWLDVPVELSEPASQRRSMPVRRDSLTDSASWLAAQNGAIASELTPRDGSRRYLLTGRDLTDYLWQLNSAVAWRNAAAIIEALPAEAKTSAFDFDDIVGMIAFASSISGDAMFYQKMYVQRRLRPEALGRIVDRGPKDSPLHADVWTTPALDIVHRRYDTRLLPQAYLEGSPTHPSYPAGHGTLAGTGVTILKAVVNEDYILPNPVLPSRDGSRLEAYQGPPLTLGGELDKLATNCALGRGTAGVHFRSDNYAGLRLGEAAMFSLMRDRVLALGDAAPTYNLTSVDGAKVTIGPDGPLRRSSSSRSS